MLVVIQNSHAAANVRVESDQKLVSTGLYGLVRHPMYTGNVIMMLGIPLALGSYWGLYSSCSGLIVLAIRILDEESCSRKSWTDTALTGRRFAIVWCHICGRDRVT